MKKMRVLGSLLILAILVLAVVFALPIQAAADNADDLVYGPYDAYGDRYLVAGSNSNISGALTIPSTYKGKPVVGIGAWALFGDTNLTYVTIPDSIIWIGSFAFLDCTGLSTVTIPKSVTLIEPGVFNGCTSLKSINVDSHNPNYSSDSMGVLYTKDKGELLRAPYGLSGVYVIPDGTTTIDREAFYGCSGLTSIMIPGSVTSIGDNAFRDCTSLITVIYCGTKEQRVAMSIDEYGNTALLDAVWQYHNWENSVCTACGNSCAHDWKGNTCTACGITCDHDWAEATCTAPKTCKNCGATDGKTRSHDWAESTCKDPETCKDCGATRGKARGHKFVTGSTPPTCTEDGLTEGTYCKACGEVQVAQEVIPATGHSFGEWVVIQKATTEAEGVQERSCSACGATEQQKLEKLQPNYTWVFVLAGVLVVGAAGAVILIKRKKQ